MGGAGGNGALHPALCVNDPKKAGGRSARATSAAKTHQYFMSSAIIPPFAPHQSAYEPFPPSAKLHFFYIPSLFFSYSSLSFILLIFPFLPYPFLNFPISPPNIFPCSLILYIFIFLLCTFSLFPPYVSVVQDGMFLVVKYHIIRPPPACLGQAVK